MTGVNGMSLQELWKDESEGYMGIIAPQMPNYFSVSIYFEGTMATIMLTKFACKQYTGPNSPLGHGSILACYDWCAYWVMKWCDKIAREGIKSITIKPDVLREFNDYAQEFLKKTVWSSECRSWYKNHKTEGRVTAVSKVIGGDSPQATTRQTVTLAYTHFRCTPEAFYIIGKCCRPLGRRTSISVI